ncbi:MAG: metallophosphoesterase [Phycisphaerae bacterium]|nr:metallophosphoesterase [Phycisphaerae bacterium]
MEPHRLRILHISDLHERIALDWMDEDRKAKIRLGMAGRHRVLASNFLDLLRQIAATTKVDLFCFTGDVADWGLADEYKAATARFKDFLEALDIAPDRLFVVPGNHDVNRKEQEPAWRKIRALPAEAGTELSNWMGGAKTPRGARATWRDAIHKRTAAFWTWLSEDMARPDLLPSAGPHGRLGYRHTPTDLALPFPVHILGLDSAWLCGDDNDAAKLLLTAGQADLLANDDSGRPLPGFRLALIHHPLSDLADGTDCFHKLADTVDLLLHGHQHDTLAELRSDPDRRLQALAAGSLYEGDDGDRWINAFHTIDVYLTDEGRPLRYDLEFWGWSPNGHWYRTGAVYQAAPDGCLTLWTPAGQRLNAEQERARLAQKLQQEAQASRVFVGRQPELDDLRDTLLDASPGRRTVAIGALQGMPGVGKSYLAEEFILTHLDHFPGGSVRIVLAADDPRDADGICRDVCDELSLATGPRVTPWEALAGHLTQPRALLLIENVDGPREAAMAAEFVRQLADAPTIITGRFQGLGRSAGWKQVLVSPFDEPHAIEQLTREWRSPSSSDEKAEFHRLVATLGYLPPAIHLATARAHRHSFATYVLAGGCHIPTVRDSPDPDDITTTMIYTQTLNRRLSGPPRPLDGLWLGGFRGNPHSMRRCVFGSTASCWEDEPYCPFRRITRPNLLGEEHALVHLMRIHLLVVILKS